MSRSVGGTGMSEPPEGAIVGESVPLENQEDEIRQSTIEELIGRLKLKGEPYTKMSRYELEERARELARKYGE